MCKVKVELAVTLGTETVGVDLGTNNFATPAYEGAYGELFLLNCLKQDDYFSKHVAHCDDSTSEQATWLHHKKLLRRTHYFHALSQQVVDR